MLNIYDESGVKFDIQFNQTNISFASASASI